MHKGFLVSISFLFWGSFIKKYEPHAQDVGLRHQYFFLKINYCLQKVGPLISFWQAVNAMSHSFSFFPDLCCPQTLLPISQGCCWCFHRSFWSKAGSSRLFSAFAPDSALHTSSLLEGIILCSIAASNTAFHHLLCHSATGVLKDTGIALEKHWTQKGTQKKHGFWDAWKMGLALPQQEHRGMGWMRHC